MRALRSTLVVAAASLSCAASAQALTVHVQSKPAFRQNVHVTAHAPKLAQGGYYYAVIVLEPYKRYTRTSPPPCSASSNMQRTDYGYPMPNGELGTYARADALGDRALVPRRHLRGCGLRRPAHASL